MKKIEEELDHESLQETTIKHYSNHRKYRCELVTEPKKQCSRIFIDEK